MDVSALLSQLSGCPVNDFRVSRPQPPWCLSDRGAPELPRDRSPHPTSPTSTIPNSCRSSVFLQHFIFLPGRALGLLIFEESEHKSLSFGTSQIRNRGKIFSIMASTIEGEVVPEPNATAPAPAAPPPAEPKAKSQTKVRKRAPKACLSCRARKVRCDVSQRGRPCMNCYLDSETCVVTGRASRL